MAPEIGRGVIDVLLLTQSECVHCETALAVVDHLSTEYPLHLETLEIDSPQGRALAEQGGILFAPGVFLDGEPFSYGRLSERRLRRALTRRCSRPY